MHNKSRRSVLKQGGILVVAVLFTPAGLVAQTGEIRGVVTASGTLEPVGSADVVVVGTTLATFTDRQGRFAMSRVPAGSQQVEVRSVGYRTGTREVNVIASEVAEVQIELEASAVSLDEIVVTGVGAPTERRRLGQTISTVNAEQLASAPVATVADALQGRVAGVSGFGGGETGQGSMLVLRGAASLTQGTEPLIYVDGVRMDNRSDRTGMIVTDPLNDINPQDIERIEVLKGAAAATLFGTEASNGVIQIFTKRGAGGPPVYSLQAEYHAFSIDENRLPTNYGFDSSTGQLLSNRPGDDFLETGQHQNYNLSVRGGSETARYSVSGRFMTEDGFIPKNTTDNVSLRTNLDFQQSDRLSTGLAMSWTRSTLTAPQPTWGIFAEFLLANPANASESRPYGEQDFTVRGVLADENERISSNLALSGTIDFQWASGLQSKLTAGYNTVDEREERFRPEGSGLDARGLRSVDNSHAYTISVDASTSWEQAFGERLTSTLVIGGQSFWEGIESSGAEVQDFPSPTLRTLSAGTTPASPSETYSEVINAGLFAQEQIGLDNRLFLTLGLRVDGNSAFGDDFGFETYPKAGLSWTVSDHDFWNIDPIETFRLRAAFGTAGLQPGAFDAERIWDAETAADNNGIVLPNNLGNPELKPERSTEREIGFEAGLLGDRVGVDFVYYNQTTTDLLLDLTPAPSLGFLEPQLFNVGELASQGIEVALNVAAIQRPGFRWTLNAALGTVDQEIVDLGGAPAYPVGVRRNRGWIREGFSPGALISEVQDPAQPYMTTVPIEELTDVSQIIPNLLEAADGSDSLVYMGNALPTWTLNLGSAIDIGTRFHIRSVFAGAGGFMMHDETDMVRTTVGVSERGARVRAVLADPTSSLEERRAAVDDYGRAHPAIPAGFIHDGKYLRMTELSLTYDLADTFTQRMGLRSGSITLGARNLFTLSPYDRIADPGAGWHTNDASLLSGANVDYFRAPLPRRFVLMINASW